MIIFNELQEIHGLKDTVVALGNFDGVHLGHKKLIEDSVDYGKSHGLSSVVFTFSNHPRNLLSNEKAVKFILNSWEKSAIIESLGVEYMVNIPFTEEIMNLSPEDFITKLLLEKLNMKTAFCGFDYRFGKKAQGHPDTMRTMGEIWGFNVFEMEPFAINGKVVSSTIIRDLISKGEVEKCRDYMGRNYIISGEVVTGKHLGRKIGFPTLNLNIQDNKLTPPPGVYITTTELDGIKYPSVTSVGYKPTVGIFDKNVETHIFDFNNNLYGKNVVVEFLKMTRKEEKFSSIEELTEQIKMDCQVAREYHETLQNK